MTIGNEDIWLCVGLYCGCGYRFWQQLVVIALPQGTPKRRRQQPTIHQGCQRNQTMSLQKMGTVSILGTARQMNVEHLRVQS